MQVFMNSVESLNSLVYSLPLCTYIHILDNSHNSQAAQAQGLNLSHRQSLGWQEGSEY